MKLLPVIGLEIHVQLKTKSKLFCASPNDPDTDQPNTNICEICTGQPGALPKLNQMALKKAIEVGLALDCQITSITKFDRKNYFYPDLPKGYQISQFDKPVNGPGQVELSNKKIGITRAHLEEDAGKLIHDKERGSYVDFNRAGVPLLEIVTDPDFENLAQVSEFLNNLRNLVRYLDASDADMEKGQLRVDANISLKPAGQDQLPDYKIEIKNLNSFKAIEAALTYEIKRQEEQLLAGEKLISQTRGWQDDKKKTVLQRGKEEAHDYRYFPEPDLPEIEILPEYVEELRHGLPELPQVKAKRFESEYGLSKSEAVQLTGEKEMANYFEQVISELEAWVKAKELNATEKVIKSCVNWLLGDFTALLNRDNVSAEQTKITADKMAEFVVLIYEGKISITAGKTVLNEMYGTGSSPEEIMRSLDLEQVSDTGELERVAQETITGNPEVVEKYKSGKVAVIGVLVGEVMKKTGGKANPKVVNEILREKLKNT